MSVVSLPRAGANGRLSLAVPSKGRMSGPALELCAAAGLPLELRRITRDEVLQADELLLSSEPYRFGTEHLAQAQALCPNARVRLVDGELISWYGPRAAAGLRYLRGLAQAPR